ncbi:AAA family ATPase [Sphingobium sp. CAP-1]|uniref:AAA family ATPase n=1 Tax=Sphingobium sp. CAP-1 TaxID=2676077 RepID=UPI0012BB3DAC|nr:ATP-binding protein [Sphingobium sp. CAP-1]QGP78702.1 AAA family ATPase [Sphingobium sp. CAP-1]
MTLSVVLHGVESTGKSVLAQRLAAHFGTIWVPEYGRTHAETHGVDMDEADLLLIGRTQAAMIAAALPRADRFLFADTDSLMTAAWAEMMIGHVPAELFGYPRADFYLLMEADVAWVADAVRLYGDDPTRTRFAAISRAVLEQAGVRHIAIGGDWEARFAQAVAAIEALEPPTASQGFDLRRETE